MRRRPLSLVCLFGALLVGMLLAAAPVGAITYGWVDANNTYSNAGAMVYRRSDGNYRTICSGTLIAPTIFLTASHCTQALVDRGITQVWVSFDPQITNSSTLIPALPHQNPGYNQSQSDSGDIAVLELAYPASKKYKGITPAPLPTAGLLDRLAAQNGLKGTTFTAVGYGLQEPTFGGGPPTFGPSGTRRFAYSEFNALNGGYIRLSQNNATGDGGTCFGDSGGPNFLPLNGSLVVVALTVTGDSQCVATNVDYRTDTASARTFLANYVTLP
jgi:secreted trypsin-like serine protease